MAGAMNAGAIEPNTVINDPGVLNVGGYRIYDWDRRNHGSINYTYVLEHSLNVGAMKAMLASKLKFASAALLVAGLVTVGVLPVALGQKGPGAEATKAAKPQYSPVMSRSPMSPRRWPTSP